MATISLSASAAAEVRADAVVVGVGSGPKGPVLTAGAKAIEAAGVAKLATVLKAMGATGKAEEVTKIPASGSVRAAVVVVVGLGEPQGRAGYPAEALRRAAGAATRSLAGNKSVALALPAETVEEVGAVAEGALLGAYSYLRYRTNGSTPPAPVGAITLVSSLTGDRAAKAALTRAEVVADAVCFARDLVNTPPSDLHPADLAAAADSYGRKAGLAVEILDERALKKGGYGGILAVGQGSENKPRLVRMSWTHPKAKKTIAFVGKGITFDSGGLSLKPADAMITMKCDMGGAAAVIGAISAIARLKLPVNVTAWAPTAENMPSGTAQRPSDVLTMYSGKTVEVLNTDAEGRLILADAIARACEESPDVLVDAATLTGAAMVALGHRTSAVMSNDDDLRTRVHELGERTGERMWPMPMPEELRNSLKSSVADMANIGERWGGALSAALFLREFVSDGVKWAHLDIAGPAFNEGEPYGYVPKGGTGVAVRTLVALAEDVAAG
ncbi:leucyl aminopeptidase [Sporichthya polymorpha]|uniref:leucyl aminopeptidase n=1 Tax=Sporichthya polymorpha TaxID=35751 RepID=UPI00036062F9|nr:leucyl aminopeptidase [Sporichthya polymorpha]